ncbi:MAG: hypothetical protein AAF559_07480 [Pseudomonadota bacterium]
MKCQYCEQYRKDFNAALHRLTNHWDYANSNEADIWERETEATIKLLDETDDLFDVDPAAAFEKLERAYQEGSTQAAHRLGWHLFSGKYVQEDHSRSLEYYRAAWAGGSQLAGLGFALACTKTGDKEESNRILRELDSQGCLAARYHLIWEKVASEKITGSHPSVLPHLEMLAERDHPSAMFWLGRMMLQGKLGIAKIPSGARMALRMFHRVHKVMD